MTEGKDTKENDSFSDEQETEDDTKDVIQYGCC